MSHIETVTWMVLERYLSSRFHVIQVVLSACVSRGGDDLYWVEFSNGEMRLRSNVVPATSPWRPVTAALLGDASLFLDLGYAAGRIEHSCAGDFFRAAIFLQVLEMYLAKHYDSFELEDLAMGAARLSFFDSVGCLRFIDHMMTPAEVQHD